MMALQCKRQELHPRWQTWLTTLQSKRPEPQKRWSTMKLNTWHKLPAQLLILAPKRRWMWQVTMNEQLRESQRSFLAKCPFTRQRIVSRCPQESQLPRSGKLPAQLLILAPNTVGIAHRPAHGHATAQSVLKSASRCARR